MTVPSAVAVAAPAAAGCPHQPPCPPADASDHAAAHIIAPHPEQGWNLLCNGIIEFDDTGELLPDGTTVAPHRPEPPHTQTGETEA